MARNLTPRIIPLIAALLSVGAEAQTVADFYRGKTIKYILAVPEGASWGLYVRTFIKHFRKHIPGNPNIVLQSMPGAGGIAAANYMFKVAPRDGTYIGTPLSTTIVFAATDPRQVMFDPRQFNWIGSLAVIQDVISVWHTAPAKTIEEAKRLELNMGSTGPGTNSFQDIALANNLLGTKFKPVRGYRGGAEINLAIERGELDGRATTWENWTSSKPEWLQQKKIIHIAQLGPTRSPEIGDRVPLLRDLVQPGEQRTIVDFIGLSLAMGRAVYAPPATPAERVAALRAALLETMNDPEYVSEARQIRLDTTSWQTGEQVERIVNDALSLPGPLIRRAKALIELP